MKLDHARRCNTSPMEVLLHLIKQLNEVPASFHLYVNNPESKSRGFFPISKKEMISLIMELITDIFFLYVLVFGSIIALILVWTKNRSRQGKKE
ncbi:EYxxD motif small membrane protein [Evansella tamaricis]|uniref:EYxxD motif small membrane protein n=1 Tax=Evansella tamaricis TaxID=2069301 RepID=UPI003CCE5AD8